MLYLLMLAYKTKEEFPDLSSLNLGLFCVLLSSSAFLLSKTRSPNLTNFSLTGDFVFLVSLL